MKLSNYISILIILLMFEACSSVKLPEYEVKIRENKKVLMLSVQNFKCTSSFPRRIVEKGTYFDIIDVGNKKIANIFSKHHTEILPKDSLLLPIYAEDKIYGFVVYPNGKMVYDTPVIISGFNNHVNGWVMEVKPFECDYDITKPVFKMKKPIGE